MPQTLTDHPRKNDALQLKDAALEEFFGGNMRNLGGVDQAAWNSAVLSMLFHISAFYSYSHGIKGRLFAIGVASTCHSWAGEHSEVQTRFLFALAARTVLFAGNQGRVWTCSVAV